MKVGMMQQIDPIIVISFNDSLNEDNLRALKQTNAKLKQISQISIEQQ